MTNEFKGLVPFYNKDSKILILGSFPSVISREDRFYYAHPMNRFWKVLAKVFEEEIIDKQEFLVRNKIALWDLISYCQITGSSDLSIKNEKLNDLEMILNQCDIQVIVLNGKKAASLYFEHFNFDLPVLSCSSTSSANAMKRENDLIQEYRKMKDYV